MKKIIKIIYSLYALLMFILLMFCVLPFVFLSLLSGKEKGGNIIYKICKLWAQLWYFFIGIKHKEIYESPHDRTHQYIFVANHGSYMDIPPVVLTLRQPYRVLGKYDMIKYPVFGWIYKAAVILVDKSDQQKRAKSVRALKAALNKGISIFIFPEGTFNETGKPLKSFYDGAFRLAIDMQTPVKPILLIDSIDRLHSGKFLNLTPGTNCVVYLKEISPAGMNEKDLQKLKQQVYEAMEAGLKKYKKY
jgi:1-acyl-sn-glycerol-3-phosphate acyltransferase